MGWAPLGQCPLLNYFGNLRREPYSNLDHELIIVIENSRLQIRGTGLGLSEPLNSVAYFFPRKVPGSQMII